MLSRVGLSMPSVKYISLQTEQSSKISEANILCLGNFDGVHLAHRTLLREAKMLQAQKMPGARVGIFCFEKRPLGRILHGRERHHLRGKPHNKRRNRRDKAEKQQKKEICRIYFPCDNSVCGGIDLELGSDRLLATVRYIGKYFLTT